MSPATPMDTKNDPHPSRRLLAWYDRHRRDLPWRVRPGRKADPYAIWISEIMLQQTTVVTAIPYYQAFLARWPTLADLAAADLDAVLHAWQGLGYYARARNLHASARMVVREHGGVFPSTEAELRALPGIGPYTAAAVAAIAFDRPACPVDGNVERVMSRLHRLKDPLPGAKGKLSAMARSLVPTKRCGDHAQALIELGATVCTPRAPACPRCPLAERCAARIKGDPTAFPVKLKKAAKPSRRGIVFWVTNADGGVLLRRRPESGLLGGLMVFPSTPWREQAWTETEALAEAPLTARWAHRPGLIGHTFTHFHLQLSVWTAQAQGPGLWVRPEDFHRYALPTVMKKIARHVLATDDSAAT